MLRGAIALALLLAGCRFDLPGAPGPDDLEPDGPIDPTDPDGDGVRTGDNCPDAANPDQADADGDAVGDPCDNCASIANPPKATLGFDTPIQRDHDLDGRGDECDLCPHLGSAAPDADQDGDLIGDACDPEPAVQNPPPYWNGFYEPPGADWQAANLAGSKDDWELALHQGKLGWRQQVLDGTRRHLLLDGEREEHHVQSSVVIEAIDPSVTLPSAAITYGFYRNAGNDYHFSCGARRNATADANLIVAAVQNGGVDVDSRNTSWPAGLVGVAIDVTGRADRIGGTTPQTGDSSITCSVPTRTPVTLSSTFFPDGQIGLRTFGTRAWFDYLFAVEPRPRP